MITIRDSQIRWAKADVRTMARVIGSEMAVISPKKTYRFAPLLLSILKCAQSKGGYLSSSAERALHHAKILRREIREWKAREDGDIDDKRAYSYFKHQREDLALLYHFAERIPAWLIASEAGVGKTLLGIRFPEHVKARRNMVIVGNAAKDQWADEIRRWSSTKLPITIIRGTIAQQMAQIRGIKRGWAIGHWESLVHARDAWIEQPWDIAVLDEIHRIQNRKAQRTETVHELDVTWRLALTAHPYANGVSELFPILKFLYPEIYTSFWRWANLHIQIDEGAFGGLDLRTPRRPSLLQWELEPFMIRHLWKDVWKNLPPITRITRTAELTARGRSEYQQIRKQFFARLDTLNPKKNILAIPSMLARVTRMRQYLIDPAILGAKERSVKYPVVLDLIRELKGQPPVIFTMWRESAKGLQAFLKRHKLHVPIIAGGMQKRINPIKKRFLRGKYDAVIILISVGGESLNFGKFGKVIYLDHPWTHKDVEQTEGRVRRPEEGTGIIVPTTSYHIVVKDSYEERMRQHRVDKHEDFAKVFTVAQARELFQ
jgi:superfamily II DNA or RNA helicase